MLDQLEAQVKCAQAEGLKVVPVLGGRIVEGKVSTESYEFWDHPDIAKNFCRIWEMVAKRLLPYRESIWAFDLINEPLDRGQMPYAPRQWRTMAISGIKAIRAVDKDVWVIYETGPGGMSWGFDGLKPLPDTHVIYGAHFYSPHEFTHQGVANIAGTDLAEAMKKINVHYPSEVNGRFYDKSEMAKDLATTVAFQKKYRVPIFFGEFSVIKWAPKEDAVKYLTDVIDIFEANGWSWTYHAFREYPGWSFEYDESFWRPGMPAEKPTTNETERAKVIKAGLRNNLEDYSLRSELPIATDPDMKVPDNAFKVLIIGNSISRHGFSDDTIKKLGWDHLSGMAASSQEKDYVHLTARGIQAALPDRSVVLFLSSLKSPTKNNTPKDRVKNLIPYAQKKYDLIIFQHGEHEHPDTVEGMLDGTIEEVYSMFGADGDPKPFIISVGNWSPSTGLAYTGYVLKVQNAIKDAAGKHGAVFVPIEEVATNAANWGTGTSGGVKWHPNDGGMRGYAERIIQAFKTAAPRFGLKLKSSARE